MHKLPFDSQGFAPSISKKSQRSRSGTGIAFESPNSRPHADVLGHLIDGARRKHVARAERLHQRPDVERAGEVVDVGIAEVHRHRVPTVAFADRRQPPLDLGEGRRPR